MKGESLVPTALVLMLNTEHIHSYSDVHIHKYYNMHIHSQVHVHIAHEKYCGIEMLSHTLTTYRNDLWGKNWCNCTALFQASWQSSPRCSTSMNNTHMHKCGLDII